MIAKQAKVSSKGNAVFPKASPLGSSLAMAWLSVGVFWFCLVVATLDRQVIAITAGAIQFDLHLSDTQLGFIQGPAFAFFAALAGVPVGWLLDHFNRVSISAACFALWSFTTTLTSLAVNFTSLAVFRGCGAVGEAGLAPAALAIFADRFPTNRIPRISSFFLTAPFVGAGLGLFVGGLLLDRLTHAQPHLPDWLKVFHPWQLVFLVVGAPGVLLAILLKILIADPARLDHASVAASVFERSGFQGAPRFLAPFIFGMTALVVIMYVELAWLPMRLLRSFHMSPSQAGLIVGPPYLIAGLVGAAISGWFSGTASDRVLLRVINIILVASLVLVVPLSAAALSTSKIVATAGFFIGSAALCTALTLASTPIQLLVSGRNRARSLAYATVAFNVVGAGVGPMLAGMISDVLHKETNSLGWAMAIIIVGAASITIGTLLSLRSTLKPSRPAAL